MLLESRHIQHNRNLHHSYIDKLVHYHSYVFTHKKHCVHTQWTVICNYRVAVLQH